MAFRSDTVNDDYGRPVPGVLVYVFNSDGSLASLYNGQANPITTDILGTFSFNVDDGVYALEYRFAGVTRRQDNVIVGTPPDYVGPTGPANSTYTTLTALKAAAVTNASYIFAPPSGGDGGATAGTFLYQTAGAPYTADGVNIIKLDAVPLSTGALVRQSAQGVAFKQSGATAVQRDMQSKAREFVSIKDFGAKGAPFDDTAAIQAAYDSGASLVYYPPGEYLHKALTITTAYQRHYGPGSRLTRTQANTTINVANSARGVHFVEMRFGCQTTGMAGDNITVNAPDFRWMFCESRDCAGRALLIANAGGGANIFGGVMQTAGLGTSAWDFELRDDPGGADTLYCAIFGVITNQGSDHTGATPVGGFLITGEVGTTTIECCQFGKLRMDNGGSSRVSHSRINSDATILSGFATFVACNLNGATVFGQTGQPNIGSICFDSTNVMANYGSLTINGNVIQSSFHLGQVVSAGTPVTIHPAAYNNDIWHPAMDVSSQIDLGAESGSPTKGNATVTAWMSAAGRDRTLRLSFQAGSTTNFGGGNYFTVSAPFISKGIATAPVRVTSNAQLLDWTAYLRNGTNQIKFTPSSGPGGTVGNDASATSPLTLGAGTLIEMSMTVEQTF